MDGLNHSVISGKCPGCAALKAQLKEAREKLEALGKELASAPPTDRIRRMECILKEGG